MTSRVNPARAVPRPRIQGGEDGRRQPETAVRSDRQNKTTDIPTDQHVGSGAITKVIGGSQLGDTST